MDIGIMKKFIRIITALALLGGTFSILGCASLVEEDENLQQTPWARPADWEGQVPGMPNRR